MIFIDILEALILYYKGDRACAYDELNDLISEFTHNEKKYFNTYSDLIKKDALENNLCPKCYNELLSKKQMINYGLEYQGQPCNEYKYIRYCPSCGWSENLE